MPDYRLRTLRRRNRDLYQIYYNILDRTREPRKITRIQRYEVTSYFAVVESLAFLCSLGMIEKNDGQEYHTTAKGLRYLSKLEKIYQLLPWLKIDIS